MRQRRAACSPIEQPKQDCVSNGPFVPGWSCADAGNWSTTPVNLLRTPRHGVVKLNPPLCDTHRCGLPLDIAVSPCGPVFALPPRTFGTSRNAMAWRCNADPGTLEDFDAFKGRVRNAVAWLNGNAKKKEEMTGAVDSMRRRLQELIRLKGARAGY